MIYFLYIFIAYSEHVSLWKAWSTSPKVLWPKLFPMMKSSIFIFVYSVFIFVFSAALMMLFWVLSGVSKIMGIALLIFQRGFVCQTGLITCQCLKIVHYAKFWSILNSLLGLKNLFNIELKLKFHGFDNEAWWFLERNKLFYPLDCI